MTEVYIEPQLRTGICLRDKQIVADVLTWDCQRPVNADEIKTIAISHDFLWVKLTENRAKTLAVETFRAIRRQQLEQQSLQQVEQPPYDLTEDIEVDSDHNSTDPVYRVWKGIKLIGTFHQSPVDDKWIASPTYAHDCDRYETPDQAQQAIVNAWNYAIRATQNLIGERE